MSIRNALMDALRELGWANCYQVVQHLEDPEVTVATAAPELRLLVADGMVQNRVGSDNRTEYAMADGVRVRGAPAVRVSPPESPMLEEGAPMAATARRPEPVSGDLTVRVGANGPHKQLRVLRHLVEMPGCTAGQAQGALNLTTKEFANLTFALKQKEHIRVSGSGQRRTYHATSLGREALREYDASMGHAAKPPVASEDPAPGEVPPVPMARLAVDELSPIADLATDADAKVDELVQRRVHSPLGLLDRADAIARDIEDLTGDACDARIDQDILKILTVASAAINRAARRMAQG